MNETKRFIVIDSNSVLHRAFHALPPLSTKKGEMVNAVYGFLLVFFKAVKEFKPDFMAACFDVPGLTFRHKEFKEYKAKRPATPENLSCQFSRMKEVLSAFGVPVFERSGFEADDIIGTVTKITEDRRDLPGVEIIIISGDADNFQLVDSKTKVYFLKRGVKDIVLYDKNLVEEKYGGLRPEQLLDFRALKGDPSDNIPGVPGVGEKTAISLIKEFGSLEKIYEDIFLVKEKLREILSKNKEAAFLSKKLSEIQRNAPFDFDLDKCAWGNRDRQRVEKIFNELEFYSLIERLDFLDHAR